MIEVSQTLKLDENEIQFDFIRASGPGGQNVNKVASAVQLRFQVLSSSSLPEDVRLRLARLAGKRINDAGELVIQASRYRTQEQNKQDAVERLLSWIRRAAEPPKPRKKTRPTAASRQRRLESKRQRGEIKQLRRKNDRQKKDLLDG